MCCFSGPVASVSSTRIFARMVAPGRQALVYSMAVAADREVAMILPVPTPPGAAADAVRFIALDGYRELFDDLAAVFGTYDNPYPGALCMSSAPPRLEVVQVGDFEASFVPSPADFARLDPRFRFPEPTLAALSGYADWGFCVFKLRDLKPDSESAIHPMAFDVPTRAPDRLFIPTLHVHDGTVHPEAEFDHVIYVQSEVEEVFDFPPNDRFDLIRAWDPVAEHVDVDRARGLVRGDLDLYREWLTGKRPNEDTWYSVAPR